MATNRVPFTVRFKEENLEKIKVIAEYNNRSASSQIEHLVEEHIRRFENKNGKIKTE